MWYICSLLLLNKTNKQHFCVTCSVFPWRWTGCSVKRSTDEPRGANRTLPSTPLTQNPNRVPLPQRSIAHPAASCTPVTRSTAHGSMWVSPFLFLFLSFHPFTEITHSSETLTHKPSQTEAKNRPWFVLYSPLGDVNWNVPLFPRTALQGPALHEHRRGLGTGLHREGRGRVHPRWRHR